MTIRLLAAYPPYPINAIVTLDAGTEAGLVAAKLADTNTAGGKLYLPPKAQGQRYPAQMEVTTHNHTKIVGPDGSSFDFKNVIAAVAALAGRRSWPTKGISAVWPKQYSRIPRYWIANKTVGVGSRFIVSHSSVAAGSDIPFDQSSTTSTTRYFVLTCTQAGTTGASKPSISSSGATEIVDGSAKWIAADVFFIDPVGGNDANNGNSPSAPFQTAKWRDAGVLNFVKCGTSLPAFNTSAKLPRTVNGVSNMNMLSWYGDFAGAGAPQVSAYLGNSVASLGSANFEFFQIDFTTCTGAHNTNLAFYGCKFRDRLSLDYNAAGEYGYLVIEDCDASGHATVNYDGISVTINAGAALDRLVRRNVTTTSNNRYGFYLGMGTNGAYTAASAGTLRYYEEVNCLHGMNGRQGAFVENPSCTIQPLNRIWSAHVANNEYLDNNGHACTYGGFGRLSDAEYQNVFTMNKAARNNFGAAASSMAGTGGMQFCGLYRGVIEYNDTEANGSSDYDYDGCGIYCDVVSAGGTASEKQYTTAGGCAEIIVRYNVSRNHHAVKWISSHGRWLPADRLFTPASQGIALYKTQGADVYGNAMIGNGVGILMSMAYGVDTHDNLFLNNDTGVLFARDGGGNKARNNTMRGGYIGIDQADPRVVAAGATATFSIAPDPFGVWNVVALTCSAAILNDLQLVYEVNGTGLGVVMSAINANTTKLCVLSPFSKTSYAAGEIEINGHRNLSTNPNAKGSISTNSVTGLKSSPNNGSAWGTPGWSDDNKYANGLLEKV